jgi:hypothetical protein
MQTGLILSIGGLPPMSARGCVQELTAIPQGRFQRTINGKLIFIGNEDYKYRSVIKCTDKATIAVDGLKIGQEVHIGCIQQLCQKVEKNQNDVRIQLDRVPVMGSLHITDDKGNEISEFKEISEEGEYFVELNSSERDIFVFYNPYLLMRIMSFTLITDEWNMKVGWELESEEI